MPLTKAPKRRLRKEADRRKVATAEGATASSEKVPFELQQRILDIFKDACADSLNDSLAGTIQEIKQCLFERDFVRAFGNAAFLGAYTARWSPSRALTYLDILCSLPALSNQLLHTPCRGCGESDLALLAEKLSIGDGRSTVSDVACPRQKVVSVGAGGGAELIAFIGASRHLHIQRELDQNVDDLHKSSVPSLDCVFIDIADWSPMLRKLHSIGTANDRVSHGTSTASDDGSMPLITASELDMKIIQQDVLESSQHDFSVTCGGAALVTIMFTLNELYSTSLASTTRMLLSLTTVLEPGALLLIVDSPGSYSTVSLEKPSNTSGDPAAKNQSDQTSRKYPMQWLLDHTLLDLATTRDSKNESCKKWEKLKSIDSQWFRLSAQLRYPLELEDMRYQMHLYQRL